MKRITDVSYYLHGEAVDLLNEVMELTGESPEQCIVRMLNQLHWGFKGMIGGRPDYAKCVDAEFSLVD